MINLAKENERFEHEEPQTILKWGWETFRPDIALLSSFGTESVVLLHMVSQYAPAMKVLFLETGYHFPETHAYKKLLAEKLRLNVVELSAAISREEFVKTHGDDLYDKNPDRCCEINKVEPLARSLAEFRAWVSGIRRGQGPTRKDIHILELYEGGLPEKDGTAGRETPSFPADLQSQGKGAGAAGRETSSFPADLQSQGKGAGAAPLYKLNPLANWSSKDAWQYVKAHALPAHPLFEKGYTSIGCWPCTRPVLPGQDDRAGRWAGRVKTECGIHTFMKPKEK